MLLLLMTGGILTAQNSSLDNLQKQLANVNNAENKAQLSYQIAALLKTDNPDSAIVLGKEALQFFVDHKKNYEAALSNIILSQAYNNLLQREIAKTYNDKAFEISSANNYDSIKGISFLLYAEYFKAKSEYDKTIENAHNALAIFDRLNVKSSAAKAKGIMAQIYQMKGDLDKAEVFLKEIINQPGTDANSQINGMHTLANIYGMEGKYDEALALDARGLELCETANLPSYKSVFYDNMANCYMY